MTEPFTRTLQTAGDAEPVRVQLSRAKGWRIPENTVVVSRPSRWGNPFIVGQDGTREECTRLFAYMLNGYLSLGSSPSIEEQRIYRAFASENLRSLKGKHLACWCRLPKDGEPDHCHAAVLLEIANRSRKESERLWRQFQARKKEAEAQALRETAASDPVEQEQSVSQDSFTARLDQTANQSQQGEP